MTSRNGSATVAGGFCEVAADTTFGPTVNERRPFLGTARLTRGWLKPSCDEPVRSEREIRRAIDTR